MTKPGIGPRLLGVVLAALISSTCGGEGTGRAADGEAPRDTSMTAPRVALLTSGPVSDAGWYAGAYEGLLLLRDSLGSAVSHQETKTPAEFDEAFRAYAGEGYDIVFAHGFEYQDAALRAGEAFPGLTIIVSGGSEVRSNVVPLLFALEDATYLAGIAAGGMTRSGVVGMVGGVAIPPAQGAFEAFEAGVRVGRSGVRVLETWIGSWDDVSAAKEATTAQLRQGADVIIHDTDAASFGMFQSVREASEAGATAWAIGTNKDQNDIAPEITLGSAVIRIPQSFLEVARLWSIGQLGGTPVYSGMREGVVDYVPNPVVVGHYPDALLDEIAAARRGILTGELEVPRAVVVEGESGGG